MYTYRQNVILLPSRKKLSWEFSMNKKQVLDLYFLDARAKLLDVAAFIDRLDRADGKPDVRWENLDACLPILLDREPDKTRRILECLSDPSSEPIDKALENFATGAWPGFKR
jgi:hypothetical protein